MESGLRNLAYAIWLMQGTTRNLCELAEGWMGKFVAQRVLRHKNSKQSYQAGFWTIVVLHHLAWLAWLALGRFFLKASL